MGAGNRRAGRRGRRGGGRHRARPHRIHQHRIGHVRHRTRVRHNRRHVGRVGTTSIEGAPVQKSACGLFLILIVFAFVSIPLLSIGSSRMGGLFYAGIALAVIAAACLLSFICMCMKRGFCHQPQPVSTTTGAVTLAQVQQPVGTTVVTIDGAPTTSDYTSATAVPPYPQTNFTPQPNIPNSPPYQLPPPQNYSITGVSSGNPAVAPPVYLPMETGITVPPSADDLPPSYEEIVSKNTHF